jgi:hypothetical protein
MRFQEGKIDVKAFIFSSGNMIFFVWFLAPKKFLYEKKHLKKHEKPPFCHAAATRKKDGLGVAERRCEIFQTYFSIQKYLPGNLPLVQPCRKSCRTVIRWDRRGQYDQWRIK